MAETATSYNRDTVVGATAPMSTADSLGYVFEDSAQRIILAVVLILVAIIGIPGNIMVVTAVAVSKRLQTKTNVFVVNLACSDLATSLVLPLQAVALLSDRWPLPGVFCAAVAVVGWASLTCSVITLALIAFNRYYLIKRPRYDYERLFSRRNLSVVLSLTWIVSIASIVVPTIFGVGTIGYSERYRICSPETTDPDAEIYTILGSVLVDLPCFVVIAVCYIKIYRFVSAQSKNLAGESSQHVARSLPAALYRRQVKVTKNLFLVVCMFIICIIPWVVVSLIPMSFPAKPWVSVFLISNCCINPIVYGLNHPQFKEAFGDIIFCKLGRTNEKRRETDVITTSTSL